MSNPTGKTADAPLPAETLARLRRLLDENDLPWEGIDGVGGAALTRALAGLPVRPATRTLIEHGLERLRKGADEQCLIKLRTDFEEASRVWAESGGSDSASIQREAARESYQAKHEEVYGFRDARAAR